MIDKNNNGIDDREEKKFHYILIGIILSISTPALFLGYVTSSDFRWIIIVCAGLAVGFDAVKKIF